ncbi:DUF6768 family protein [Sinisalibacter aestuarii]|uniref:DUF4282 domain-containing protein n=1 Tax=Sinisalibacter aestuarii TaxID=2949426 RepID=A0ABQ5LRW9_9RHOB|nr:DUF6768 family protein [Sinisalibacter aestuarii]GKY87145.1 hypothetical protein STA1M1_10140 [Sinisalibacter aestuarii]
MSKLDRMIEEALSAEERALMTETVEPGFFAQLFGQLSGRNAWVNWLATIMIFVYLGLLVWTGWHFFAATDALAAVKWGLGAGLSLVIIGMMKLYLFQAMQADRVIRELKRVELMLVSREK